MTDDLLRAVRRYTEAHSDLTGLARTPIPGLIAIRQTKKTELQHAINRPLVCLVVQGTKQISLGDQSFTHNTGSTLLITADVPTVSQIARASPAEPYLSLALYLDPTVIAELSVEMKVAREGRNVPVRIDPTDQEVADTALRLMRLLERPESVPVLQAQVVREMHYWLLSGRHGTAVRRLGCPESHAQRIARAVALIREEYAKPLPVERLAEAARMSASSFHQHFRAITTLSPLQFQKQLRLIEARRLMLVEGASASHAAYTVGYESVPQFTREYGRMFGLSPVKYIKVAKGSLEAVA
ncbi:MULTISPECIES: AraC family transcriptional regulator [unclassified Sinorhizobium]|uniref:AraC family transcriptional regulator n=1 Tax=unclassified Sinorhizobium TaxID=2613772 RepID=UPI0024C3343A|nr:MULTISPECIES: AraC family transcriptional regulator [unclassified Sinorhizobium]MDK1374288.1 AraC family transcriptional regulator [Sinorhizobium sp. 6-70]MDK1479432.1 AraC family transcriptional regulator [Sinorhizobium sp. 6-117]